MDDAGRADDLAGGALRGSDSAQRESDRLMMNATVIYLGLVFVMSVVCFAAYGLDKRRAVSGNRRMSEQTLGLTQLTRDWRCSRRRQPAPRRCPLRSPDRTGTPRPARADQAGAVV